jgi:hypothetical protein
MQLPETPAALEEAVRRSFLADSLAEGRTMFDRYVTRVESDLRALMPGSEAALELETRARRLLDWVGIMAQASRESASAELERLRLLAGYRAAGGSPPSQPRQS